jgi:hypothetical protein
MTMPCSTKESEITVGTWTAEAQGGFLPEVEVLGLLVRKMVSSLARVEEGPRKTRMMTSYHMKGSTSM